eukprot:g5723.t1
MDRDDEEGDEDENNRISQELSKRKKEILKGKIPGGVVEAKSTRGRCKGGAGLSSDQEKAAEAHVGWHHRQNGDSKWFNNPMYRVTTTKRGKQELFISLSQEDRRMKHGREIQEKDTRDENFSIDFTVVKKPLSWQTRVWEEDPSEVICKASDSNFASKFPQREVSKGSVVIDYKHTYFIIPHTMTANMSCKYTLRVFCKEEINVAPVMETYSQILRGKWQEGGLVDTAGGPLLLKDGEINRTWSQNPQFALFLPPDRGLTDRTTVKIVLKRLGNRKKIKEDEKIAVAVVKPTTTLPSTRRKKEKAVKKEILLQDKPLPPTAPSSLSMTALAENASTSGEIPIERKLQVQPDEWAIMSYFENPHVSCTLLRELSLRFCEQGLLIIPMMEKEADGDFQLEVHSDLPVAIRHLPESNMQTIGSAWVKSTAGGCHVDESSWRKNPKFLLQLHGQEGTQADVNITLARPEKSWANRTVRDPVASMIGFYLIPTTNSQNEGEGIRYKHGETFCSEYVPMHSVATPEGFTMQTLGKDGCYIIVPCTYAPGWIGDFSLSVSSDVEFTFTKYKR